jgi:membrane-bound lytic murein transglycosylase D
MNKLRIVTVLLAVVLLSGSLIFAVSFNETDNIAKKGTAQYFPNKVDFAGEQAPLHIADVKERLDRELLVNTYLHSSTILIMKRANRVFPVIEPILKQYGVPDDFKYLAVIESALTNAVSPSGARGVWQFMTPTAKESGMEINDYVDERYHLEKATVAACNYLITAKQKFGSWTLAAASYNGGMTGVNTKITEQKVDTYYDLLLTDETSRYVFRILALKEIMKNPKSYGFDVSNNELYPVIPAKKIEIDSTINNLATFAKTQGINYKILKLHNPWLRDKKLPNPTKKKYIIEIPTSGY